MHPALDATFTFHIHYEPRNFNSCVPHGMQPATLTNALVKAPFQFMHPAGDATMASSLMTTITHYFNSYIQHGMQPALSRKKDSQTHFNSCIPAWDATIYGLGEELPDEFQFMHPARNATQTGQKATGPIGTFQFMHPAWDATDKAETLIVTI